MVLEMGRWVGSMQVRGVRDGVVLENVEDVIELFTIQFSCFLSSRK